MLIEISLKLGYRTVNARKYVRCARTYYFILLRLLIGLSRAGAFNLLSSRANLHLHIILRAAVIADYKIMMDILNIIIGKRAAHQVT